LDLIDPFASRNLLFAIVPLEFRDPPVFSTRWPCLIIVPFILIAIYALAFLVIVRSAPLEFGVSYLVSLGVALLIGGLFFKTWERTFSRWDGQ